MSESHAIYDDRPFPTWGKVLLAGAVVALLTAGGALWWDNGLAIALHGIAQYCF